MAERRRTPPEENIPPATDLAGKAVDLIRRRALNDVKRVRPDISRMRKTLNARRSRDVRRNWRARIAEKTATVDGNRRVFKRGKMVGYGLDAIGAGVTAHGQLRDSTATNKWGKRVDAALAGGADFVLGKTPVAVVDAVVQLGLEAAGINPKGWTIGDNLNTGIRGTVTLGDALITGDNEGLATFHESSLRGDYGPISTALSQVGDDISKDGVAATVSHAGGYWSQYGVVGGFKNVRYLFGD